MKKMMKKGFTLVELVIVIAVIAILAAILIPTFSSLIRKANLSTDTVLAKNLNTAVSIYKYENGKLDITVTEAIKAVNNRGYVLANLNAKTEGCYFVWDDQYNQFLLIEETDEGEGYKILHQLEENCYEYKKSNGEENKNWCFATSDVDVIDYICGKYDNESKKYAGGKFPGATFLSIATDIATFKNFMNRADETGEKKFIYLDEEFNTVTFNDNDTFKITKPDTEVVIELGTAKINRTNTDNYLFQCYDGTMTIEDGTIVGGTDVYKISIYNKGDLIVKGSNFEGSSMFIQNAGGTTTISDCTMVNVSSPSYDSNGKAVNKNMGSPIFSNGGLVTLTNVQLNAQYHGVFVSAGGVVEVYSGDYSAKENVFFVNNLSQTDGHSSKNPGMNIDVCDCPWTTVKIYGGTFAVPSGKFIFKFQTGTKNGVATVHNRQVYIYGGTFKIGNNVITVTKDTSTDTIKSLFANNNNNSIYVEQTEDGKGFRVYRYN